MAKSSEVKPPPPGFVIEPPPPPPGFQFVTPIEQVSQPSPTQGMSFLDLARAGAGKAFTDLGMGIGQKVGLYGVGDVEQKRALDAPLMETLAGQGGAIAGEVAGMAGPGGMMIRAGKALQRFPVVAEKLTTAGRSLAMPRSFSEGATGGAAYGFAQPAIGVKDLGINVLLGGVSGGSVAGAPRLASPNVNPQVQGLMKEGVEPTIGQILGGAANRIEERAMSVPFLGDMIRGRRNEAQDALRRAAFARALDPVGERLPKGLDGSEAVEHVYRTLGDKYDRLLPKLTVKTDSAFAQELGQIQQNVALLPAAQQDAFVRVVSREFGKFQRGPQGSVADGKTLKGIEENLRTEATRLKRMGNSDSRDAGYAIQEVLDALRGAVERSNPQFGPELRSINKGYANYKRLERAASYVGAEDGKFTAGQLQSAVKAADRTKDHRAFAQGKALMQDLSGAGKNVLGDKVPDSGTAGRLLQSGSVGQLLSLGSAAAGLPFYSTPGQRIAVALLARRPEVVKKLGNVSAQITPYVTAPAIATMLNASQQ